MITQPELESYLWGAATLLRGTIDAGDYKQFIFPLLFYKRLCDVFDEELAEALKESSGDMEYAELPEQHRFQIPPDAHWKVTRNKVKNIGKAIQDALRDIETANPDRLYSVFGDARWTNKDRLPDSMLRDLIEHFSSQTLSLANCPEDELGVGYEFLIKKFADDSGHTAAEFYTNRTVVHLMTEMLEPKPGESIYDPTCGSAGMLLSAVTHLKRRSKEWRNLKLFGQERNLLTSAIGRMNLFLHGIEDFKIIRGDTLAHPAFVEGDRLKQFDIVLANPSQLTFSVAVDEIQKGELSAIGSVHEWAQKPEDVFRRSYATREFRQRLHQSAFRERVLRAYRDQCALCRLRHRELLDAAHILPDAEPEGEPVVSNGLSLCKLHHAAFDRYFVGIREDYVVEVRPDILKETDGPMLIHGLQSLHGSKIIVPRITELRPNPEFLHVRYERFRAAG